MTHLHTRSSGRALPVLLVLVAVGLLAFLYFADPLEMFSGTGDDAAGSGADTDLLDADGSTDAATTDTGTEASLGSVYGDGAYGAIRLRLRWVGSAAKPVVGQSVTLLGRRGEEVNAMPSDTQGVVLFAQVRPAKGYQLHIQGEGFSEVRLRSITVHNQATKDLGDLILGKDIVLRGRVVDAQGRPVPGTSVSVHTIERQTMSKGMIFTMAEQAAAVPFPLQAVKSDQEGNFAFGALDDGQYSLVARQSGFASKHETDVIVAHERGAGVLTMVMGLAGRVTGTVVDPDEKPIKGAQVVAIRDSGWRGRLNALEREVALTDEDGTYVIDTLAAGQRYRFGVIAKGYAPVYRTQPVEITEADEERNFTLQEGGTLEGVITDEATGRPLADARVAVFVGRMNFGRNGNPDDESTTDTRRTDAEGHFKFEGLTPGPVATSVVQAKGYATKSFSQWTQNQWPEVEAGQTTEVRVALLRGGTVKGFVLSGTEKEPVQGAEVTVMGSGWAAMGAVWAGAPSAISGADGGFELTGVLPGKYNLHAVAIGYSAEGGREGLEIEVPESGGTVERDIKMSTAGVVEGVVKDPEGEPIAGVRIRMRQGRDPNAQENGGNRGGGRMNWARNMLTQGRLPVDLTDDNGHFRLDGVPADVMWIVFGESSEYVSGETKSFKVAAGETKKVEIEMLPGGALRGRVVDENGRFLPGARVQVGHLTEELLKIKNLSSWRAQGALAPEVYMTDDEGRFLATNLESGPAIVRAQKEGYVTYFKRNLTIKAGETVESYTVALSKGEAVEGTILGADGQPLQGAMVAVTKQSDPGGDQAENPDEEASEEVEPMMFGRTDDQGKYKIENVKPGIYSVVVWFAGGHKGWRREKDEAAIHREVSVPAPRQDFKLNKAEPRGDGNMPGGNRGGRDR